ncbi:MAG: hypothetical protein H7178_01680 [Chitinophagaceae bacterium]|nr:hypothetical protein [Chitinophagaceae bacterium]
MQNNMYPENNIKKTNSPNFSHTISIASVPLYRYEQQLFEDIEDILPMRGKRITAHNLLSSTFSNEINEDGFVVR